MIIDRGGKEDVGFLQPKLLTPLKQKQNLQGREGGVDSSPTNTLYARYLVDWQSYKKCFRKNILISIVEGFLIPYSLKS